MTGVVKAEVEIWNTVQEFIKVRAAKKGRVGSEENKSKRNRGNRKGKQNEDPDEDEDEADGENGGGGPCLTGEQQPESMDDSGELIQVVHKIDSFEMETGRYLLFSAVGCVICFLIGTTIRCLLTVICLEVQLRYSFAPFHWTTFRRHLPSVILISRDQWLTLLFKLAELSMFYWMGSGVALEKELAWFKLFGGIRMQERYVCSISFDEGTDH